MSHALKQIVLSFSVFSTPPPFPLAMLLATYLNSALYYAAELRVPLLISALLASIIYKYRSHAIGAHPRRDLKEPKGAVPLLGHLIVLASYSGPKLYEFLEKQNRELGSVWSISLPFFGRMIQGDTPELIEYVLKTNFQNYIKGPMLMDMLADIIGIDWRYLRKLIVQIFSVKAFHDYTNDTFVMTGHKVVEYLGKAADEGSVVNIYALMHHYTMDSFSAIMCGQSFGCLDDIEHKAPLAAAFDRLLGAAADRLLDPTRKLSELLTGARKTIRDDRALIQQFFQDIIDKRRKEECHGTKRDLLQLFMEWKDENGQALPDDVLVDNIFQMTVAAYDTTAQATSWMFYLMLRDGADKDIIKILTQEVDDVLKGLKPTYTTHKQQKYAEACFLEALRMYPPGAKIMRKCAQDDVLPGGIKIHKGDWFAWSPIVMGKSEALWGPDAREYKPSRWMDAERPPQSKFPAFSAGPRACPGQRFAVLEAMTIIGMILQSFEIELVHPSETPEYGMSMTLPMVHGLEVRVSRRADNREI
ncbi:hypothetical protein BGZ72_010908 [Mortierella alpina]|nr:hypothetical protein BGZ72_010908 [Mortierella alpina]